VSVRILNTVRFPIGGIRSYLRYTYSRFDPATYATTVVTVDRPEAKLLADGMKPLPVQLHLVDEKRAVLGLARAIGALASSRRFGLIHSQGSTAALLSAGWGRLYGLPHIITLHETFRPEQFAGALGAIKRQSLAFVLGSADRVITVSSDARDNLLAEVPLRAAAAQRVEVVRNGVAVDLLVSETDATRPQLRRTFAIPDDTVLVGYVGRFMPEKGFDVLLDAARRLRAVPDLPPFRLAAVNDGAFVREYRKQAEDLGLQDVGLFTGFQPSAAGTLAELDAVIMPSRREACPLVAMEAMVLGCPLIASDCLGLRELTRGTPSLTSVAGDSQSLAGAIEQFIRHRDRFRADAAAFVSTARRSFDSSVAAGRLVDIFDTALVSRGRRAAMA